MGSPNKTYKGQGDRLLNNLLAPEVDKPIFIVIDCVFVEIIGIKSVAISATFHRLERTAFVFTRRTEVRLGGFNMHI